MPTITTKRQLDLLQHLVRFPTITDDPATNRAALDWIEQQLEGLPLHILRLENQGVPCLVATTTGTKNRKAPKLWLAAHMDVVAAEAQDFAPVVHEGRLYGRGTHDMKFAVACYIELLQELGPALANYDLGLLITTDEEVGGEHGVRWLVEDQGFRGSAVLLPDSSTPWQIELSSKGITRYELTATGRAAHASKPWQGINAIDEAMAFVNNLRTHFPVEPCGDDHHQHNTLNLGVVSGGLAVNQVASSATAQIDIRSTADTSLDTVRGWIEQAKTAMPNVDTRLIRYDRAAEFPEGEASELFRNTAQEVAGITVGAHHAHGGSDGRFFTWAGVPVVNVGIVGSGYHTSPEWIDIADFSNFCRVTRAFVERWAKVAHVA
jgi:succinyl-diaminopimelate desuccinylase